MSFEWNFAAVHETKFRKIGKQKSEKQPKGTFSYLLKN